MLFVYVEDNQMYWVNQVLMESTKPVDPKLLEQISWTVIGAGRVSTPAWQLIQAAKERGIELIEVARFEKIGVTPQEWKDLPIVIGATGNY